MSSGSCDLKIIIEEALDVCNCYVTPSFHFTMGSVKHLLVKVTTLYSRVTSLEVVSPSDSRDERIKTLLLDIHDVLALHLVEEAKRNRNRKILHLIKTSVSGEENGVKDLSLKDKGRKELADRYTARTDGLRNEVKMENKERMTFIIEFLTTLLDEQEDQTEEFDVEDQETEEENSETEESLNEELDGRSNNNKKEHIQEEMSEEEFEELCRKEYVRLIRDPSGPQPKDEKVSYVVTTMIVLNNIERCERQIRIQGKVEKTRVLHGNKAAELKRRNLEFRDKCAELFSLLPDAVTKFERLMEGDEIPEDPEVADAIRLMLIVKLKHDTERRAEGKERREEFTDVD